MEISLEVSNETLRKAIELRMSDVYPAMNIANMLSGSRTDAWDLTRKYRLVDLVAEALDRLLPVGEFYCSVTEKKFADCKSYLKVRNEIGGRQDFPQ